VSRCARDDRWQGHGSPGREVRGLPRGCRGRARSSGGVEQWSQEARRAACSQIRFARRQELPRDHDPGEDAERRARYCAQVANRAVTAVWKDTCDLPRRLVARCRDPLRSISRDRPGTGNRQRHDDQRHEQDRGSESGACRESPQHLRPQLYTALQRRARRRLFMPCSSAEWHHEASLCLCA
jgi:hypothetical protein